MEYGFGLGNFTRCINLSTPMVSKGMLVEKSINNVLYGAVPNLELQMGLIFLVAQGISFALKNFGVPGLVAQILAGLVFNPTILGKVPDTNLFTRDNVNVLATAAALGYQFFMFIHGVKVNVGTLKNVGRKAVLVGILSVSLPVLISALLSQAFTLSASALKKKTLPFEGFPMASAFSMTSLPVIICLLNDLKLLNSELGRLGLSTALVGDLFSLVIIICNAIFQESHAKQMGRENFEQSATNDVLLNLGFIIFVVFVLRPILNFLAKGVKDGEIMKKESHIFVIIAMFLGFLSITHFFGLFTVYGAFVFGLAVPAGPPFGTEIVNKFEVISEFFFQIFVTTCGMRVDYRYIHRVNLPKMRRHAFISLVVYLSKFLVCFLSHFYWELPKAESAAFALIICAKGAVDLAYYCFLNDNLFIGNDMFNFMFASVVIVATLVPILIRQLYNPSDRYRGLQKRSVMDSKPDSGLQIICCIHVPGDVLAAIKLLGATGTRDSPVVVNVIHLVKLAGQSNPVFISHPKTSIVICEYQHSENVVRFFNDFERDNHDTTTVQAMTAVSPPSFMYDDVCNVALDKRAAIIILPFHIRWWPKDGSIESEDQNIRNLNLSILERSPCSAGILVDRLGNRKVRTANEAKNSPTYNVATIFLGGEDDREALTFAKRMAQDTNVKLSVLHLMATTDKNVNRLESTYDNMVLASIKDSGYVSYREEVANDAMATSTILRPMVNEYDLLVVGRGIDRDTPQIDGLNEWCEYHELGILGDLLVSKDFNGSCSVFVVQKQQLF